MHQVAQQMHEIAVGRGWDPATWDNLGTKAALVITELDEAVQWVEGIGKDPIGVELADAAIRILACLHGVYGDSWAACRIATRRRPERTGVFVSIEVALWPVIRNICGVMECWRRGGAQDRKDAMIHLELALLSLYRIADRMEIDLDAEIARKAAYNATRPRLHGKGRSVG